MKREDAEYIAKSFKSVLIVLAIVISVFFIPLLFENQSNTTNKELLTEDKSKAIYENLITLKTTEKFTFADLEPIPLETITEPKTINTTKKTYNNYSYTVYITDFGSKYHRSNCGSLWDSCYSIDYEDAIAAGYEPCSRCNP